MRLAPEWQPARDDISGVLIASGRLWDFTEKIASSRREGKNRRDGATVSTRVVRLTDDLGQKLFEEAIAGTDSSKKGKGKGKGKKGGAAPARLSKEDEKILKADLKESKRRRTLENRAHL